MKKENAAKGQVLEIVANRLPTMRTFMKLSQQNIADLIGITRNAYASYEEGRFCPDALTLNEIVFNLFCIPLAIFLDETVSMAAIVENMALHTPRIRKNLLEEHIADDAAMLANREKTKLIFRSRMRTIRKNMKIQQKTLAMLLGVNQNTYISWEGGRNCIDPMSLKIIVYDFLHIPVEEFLDETISTENLISRYIAL